MGVPPGDEEVRITGVSTQGASFNPFDPSAEMQVPPEAPEEDPNDGLDDVPVLDLGLEQELGLNKAETKGLPPGAQSNFRDTLFGVGVGGGMNIATNEGGTTRLIPEGMMKGKGKGKKGGAKESRYGASVMGIRDPLQQWDPRSAAKVDDPFDIYGGTRLIPFLSVGRVSTSAGGSSHDCALSHCNIMMCSIISSSPV